MRNSYDDLEIDQHVRRLSTPNVPPEFDSDVERLLIIVNIMLSPDFGGGGLFEELGWNREPGDVLVATRTEPYAFPDIATVPAPNLDWMGIEAESKGVISNALRCFREKPVDDIVTLCIGAFGGVLLTSLPETGLEVSEQDLWPKGVLN